MPYELGRRYRVDRLGHEADARIGTLESHDNRTGWLQIRDRLVAVPLEALRDKNVLQRIPEPAPASHFVRTFDVYQGVEV